LTLDEAQNLVEQYAPKSYYHDTYRAWENRYLPEVCARLEGLEAGRVLDIGPGWGALAVWLRSRGWAVEVMDVVPLGTFITTDLLDALEAGYYRGDICRGGVDGEWDFDLIVMGQVLTHLKWSSVAAMENVAGMLAPNGRFLLTVTDAATYDYRESEVAYPDWRDVPRPLENVPVPPNETICTYDATDLRKLLDPLFGTVRIEKPEGCMSLIATCHK
jgi:SAM-dependent methyltransferase